MNQPRRILTSALLMGLMLFAPLAQAQNATVKPIVTVAINRLDEIKKDIIYIASVISGQPEQTIAATVELQTGFFTQGLDQTKPIGIIGTASGITPGFYAFVPTKNIQQLLAPLAGFGLQLQDAGDGLLVLQTGGLDVYFNQTDTYCFISNARESVVKPPEDPAKLLDGLTDTYDLAAKLNIQAIPVAQRALAMSQIRTAMEFSLQRLPDETDAAFEARRKSAQDSFQQLQDVVDQLDSLTFGLAVDGEKKRAFVDVSMAAVDGSKLAQQFGAYELASTKLSGFLAENAAAQLSSAYVIPPSEAGQIISTLESAKSQIDAAINSDPNIPADARELIRSVVGNLMEVANGTIEDGEVDMAGSVTTDGGEMKVVAAAKVANAQKLNDSFKEIIAAAQEQGEQLPDIKLDAAQHGSATFHTVSIPIPPFEDQAQRIFGESVDLTVGFGESHIYFGFGNGNIAALKSAITSSDKDGVDVDPLSGYLSVGSFIGFFADKLDNPDVKLLAEAIGRGNDKILMTMTSEKNGSKYHIELQEGVLRAIGTVIQLQQANAAVDDPF